LNEEAKKRRGVCVERALTLQKQKRRGRRPFRGEQKASGSNDINGGKGSTRRQSATIRQFGKKMESLKIKKKTRGREGAKGGLRMVKESSHTNEGDLLRDETEAGLGGSEGGIKGKEPYRKSGRVQKEHDFPESIDRKKTKGRAPGEVRRGVREEERGSLASWGGGGSGSGRRKTRMTWTIPNPKGEEGRGGKEKSTQNKKINRRKTRLQKEGGGEYFWESKFERQKGGGLEAFLHQHCQGKN